MEEANVLRRKLGAFSRKMVFKDRHNNTNLRQDLRTHVILNRMVMNKEYTSGELYDIIKNKTSSSYKTFQRDTITLVLEGRVTGRKAHHPSGGKTTVFKRLF